MLELIDNIDASYDKQLAFDYWNDPSNELNKPYLCDNDEYGEMMKYVREIGVYENLKTLLGDTLNETSKIASLAAGVCWEAELYKTMAVGRVDFLDFSKHRIHDIGPRVIRNSGIDNDRYIRCIRGDYYNSLLEENFYDRVVLCEALMMAEYPERLLIECKRILKMKGELLVVGEPRAIHSVREYCLRKYFAKKAIPDDSGAHRRFIFEYKRIFKSAGFKHFELYDDNERFWYMRVYA